MSMYDACICYPQTKLSIRAAGGLFRELKKYKFPKKLPTEIKSKQLNIFLFSPEEMKKNGITDEHRLVLKDCKNLILICTPETRKSPLLNEMVNFFAEEGDWNRIIPVLADSIPANSFPAILFRERITVVVDEAGENQEYKENIEPLAADIRASKVSKSLKMIPYASHKIMAVLLGCNYDDLVQRALKRTHKKHLSLAIGFIALLLFVISGIVYLWVRAYVAESNARKQTQMAVGFMEDIYSNLPQRFQNESKAVESINDFLLDNMEELVYLKPRSLELLQKEEYLEEKSYDTITDLSRKASLARQLKETQLAEELYNDIETKLKDLGYGDESGDYREIADLLIDSGRYAYSAYLIEVTSDGGGLKPGDILIEIKDEPLHGEKDFIAKIEAMTEEPTVVTVLRQKDGQLERKKITLDSTPEVTYLAV